MSHMVVDTLLQVGSAIRSPGLDAGRYGMRRRRRKMIICWQKDWWVHYMASRGSFSSLVVDWKSTLQHGIECYLDRMSVSPIVETVKSVEVNYTTRFQDSNIIRVVGMVRNVRAIIIIDNPCHQKALGGISRTAFSLFTGNMIP